MTKKKNYEKKCKYKSLTENIMRLIEDNSKHLEFKDFIRRSTELNNPITGDAYSGMNVMNTFISVLYNEFSSYSFITYIQAKKEGLKLKKGSKACPVYFYKKIEDKEESEDEENSYMIMKKYSVFNLDQFELTDEQKEKFHVIREEEKTVISDNEKLEKLKALAEIKITKETRAFYSPMGDFIHMPTLDAFRDQDHWHDVLLHELTHWTGAEHRLDRGIKGKTNKEQYSKEELIAELGSFFLCLDLGIKKDLECGASYLKAYLKHASDKDLFNASSKALKAVQYLYERVGL